MEQILVTRVNNTTYPLDDRANGRVVKSCIQKTELRTNDVIDIRIDSKDYFNFTIGDSFTYLGKKYTLNQIPKVDKKHNYFEFTITFEGVQYDLRRVSFDVNIDTTGSAVYGETLTADLELFTRVLITNANRVFPGKWRIGEVPEGTETKTLSFSEEENCLNVLQNLCGEYDVDFLIKSSNNVHTLHLLQIGDEIPLEFKVGFQRGLYNLSREKVDSTDIVTRLKVYGSTRNLGTDYRSNKLVLPGKNKANSYIDNTTAQSKYGIYESVKVYEDIYPRRNGVVTSINADSIYKFSDSSMDFDLKELEEDNITTKYLLNGISAKIHFNTGMLAGYEFEVHDYNHTTKEFHIIKFQDENEYQFPSESAAFRIQPGDKYVILDIKMPQVYIDNAEAELLNKGTEFLESKQEPMVQYNLDVDAMYLQRALNSTVTEFFKIGDFIKVVDIDLSLNRYIRIKGIERDLFQPFNYKLTLSDAKVTPSFVVSTGNDIREITNIIRLNNLNDPARARRSWRDAQEVLDMVFDIEGDYYTDKIKPNSIETMHLQVGAKSMQFNLVNSYFQPNYGGDPNVFAWGACKLVHFAIDEDIKEWNIIANSVLIMNQPYYVYARCNKDNNVGVITVTTEQIKVDAGNYYYFLIGILNSYDSSVNVRDFSLMYGFSTISGRFIKTGRIQSSGGGNTYFDLDTGVIHGKISFSSDSPAFNQIQVGSRNLIDNSGNFINTSGWQINTGSGMYDNLTIQDRLLVYSHGQIGGYNILQKKLNFKLQANKDYSLTVNIQSTNTINCKVKICHSDATNQITTVAQQVTNQMTKITHTFTTTTGNFDSDELYLQLIFPLNSSNTIKVKNVQLETGNVPTEWNPSLNDINNLVANAETLAQSALNQISNLINDDLLSVSEKHQLLPEWERIKAEYQSNYFLATSILIGTTDYTAAYNDLFNYLNPIISNLSTDSIINGEALRLKFKAYYQRNSQLIEAINNYYRNNIDRINEITDFLNTTIDGNIVATGLLMVGSEGQSNAGISGFNENGPDSVRFWAGGTAQNRNKARWVMHDNGFEKGYHENGLIAVERGFDGEKWVFNMYNEDGLALFQLDSRRGLIPVSYIGESWTRRPLLKTNITNTDFNTVHELLIDYVTNNVLRNEIRHQPDDYHDVIYWRIRFSYSSIYAAFDYYNGTHPDNASYESLAGYKAMNGSRYENIADGWYFVAFDGVFDDRDAYSPGTQFTHATTVNYITNGKITQTKLITYTK